MHRLPFLYLKPSPLGGRGVFTGEAIPEGSVVELSPVIVLSEEERALIHATSLHDYYFVWAGEGAAIALGFGSLYNHSGTPNLEYLMDYAFENIRFSAQRDIDAGEELFINYMDGDDRDGLWFLDGNPGD